MVVLFVNAFYRLKMEFGLNEMSMVVGDHNMKMILLLRVLPPYGTGYAGCIEVHSSGHRSSS
jgi:hypothetical protein